MVIKSTGNHFGTNLASLVLIFISVLVLKGVLGINENYLNIIRILGCLYIRPLAKVKPPQSKFHEISEIKSFSDSEFQRLVGVPRPVFSEMIEVLKEVESLKRNLGVLIL